MKSFKILFYLLLLSTVSVSAQYGNGYYRPNSGPGVIRNNGMPPTQTPKELTAEEIEKNRTERIDSYMSHLKNDLNLDELQYIAIKNELTASSKKMDIVAKSEFSDEDKTNEIQSIQAKLEKSIMSYLNPTQRDKYQLLKVQKSEKKDEKKKKKGKDKEQEETKN